MTHYGGYEIETTTTPGQHGEALCARVRLDGPDIPPGLPDAVTQYLVDTERKVRQRAISIREAGLQPRLEYVEGAKHVDTTAEPDLLGLCYVVQFDSGEFYFYVVPTVNPYDLN